jgi:hypothetical protein
MKIKRRIAYTENLDEKGYVIPFKKNGVKMVTMQNDKGELVNNEVHMLVAQAYVPNPNNYKFVKFKDRNHDNCKATNLYWSETQ